MIATQDGAFVRKGSGRKAVQGIHRSTLLRRRRSLLADLMRAGLVLQVAGRLELEGRVLHVEVADQAGLQLVQQAAARARR